MSSNNETIQQRLNRIREQMQNKMHSNNPPPNYPSQPPFANPNITNQQMPYYQRPFHNTYENMYGPSLSFNSNNNDNLMFTFMQQQMMQQANQQNNNMLVQRIESEKRKSRELMKRMNDIKRMQIESFNEHNQEEAMYVAENLNVVLNKKRERYEMERQQRMEERQMQNMEMLVSAVASNHTIVQGAESNAISLPPLKLNSATREYHQPPNAIPNHPNHRRGSHHVPHHQPRPDSSSLPPVQRQQQLPQQSTAPAQNHPQQTDTTGRQNILPQPPVAKSKPPLANLAKLESPDKKKVDNKPLELLSVTELVKHTDKGIDDLVAFLDFSADEVSEEEKKRIKDEKDRKRKEKERKMLILQLQGQYKPLYRHRRDGVANPAPGVIMKGRSLFRTIAFTVMGNFLYINNVKEFDFNSRMAEESNVEKDCKTFMEMAQTLLSRSIRAPMLSIVEDKKLQIDVQVDKGLVKNPFAALFGGGSKVENSLGERMLRLKVRVMGILKALAERNEDWISGNNVGQMQTIVNYLKLFFKDRVYWPKGMLFESEKTFLDLLRSGTMRMPVLDPKKNKSITPSEVALFRKYAQRIVLSLMIHRVLIPRVILSPSQCGLGRPVNKHAEKNTILVASIFYMLLRRIYSGGEVKMKSQSEIVTVLGIPEGTYKDKTFRLTGGLSAKSGNANSADSNATSNNKDDNNTNDKDNAANTLEVDIPRKSGDMELLPSIISLDNKHIHWHVLLSYKWRDEPHYEVKIIYEPEEKFSFDTSVLSKARKAFIRLYERSFQVLNEKHDAILHEEAFGPFTKVELVKNPGNEEVMAMPNADFDMLSPEERKINMPKGPWVFSIEFLTQKYDDYDPESAPKIYIIFEKRFPRTNLFCQVRKTLLNFHPSRTRGYPPEMNYTEDKIASMVYPWARWSNTEATKYLDEKWINSMKEMLLGYADTIVTHIIDSYTTKDNNAGMEKKSEGDGDTAM